MLLGGRKSWPSHAETGQLFVNLRICLILLYSASFIDLQVVVSAASSLPTVAPQQRQLGNFLSPTASKQNELKHQGGSSGVTQNSVHNEEDNLVQPDELLQVSLISARGSLAFWRPLDHPASDTDTPLSQAGRCMSKLHRTVGSQSSSRRSELLVDGASLAGTQQSTSAELVAVEGTNLKLNFVIIGQQLLPPTNSQAVFSHVIEQQQQPRRLRLEWTHNGRPIAPGKRFTQQLINENVIDMMRQFFPQKQQHLPGNFRHQSNISSSEYPVFKNLSPLSGESSRTEFILAPFVDQQHFSRLIGQLADGRKPPTMTSQAHVDDFIADGLSIDWTRLESYLQTNARDLKLFELSTSADCSKPEVKQMEALEQQQQLAVVQVELSRLTRADRGLYQLRVCPGGATVAQCRAAELSFALQVAEDIPVLVMKPERQLLEPGERLSIKCTASGFTLPQVTWFLDGQQINEQQQQQHSNVAHRLLSQTSSSSAMLTVQDEFMLMNGGASQGEHQSRLRIGDYVSSDLLVHSFVNSSSVEPEDAGYYRCQANNGLHSVEHEIRLDVRGPASIARSLRNTSALAGQAHLALQCPFSGSPILAIEWYFLAPDTDQAASVQDFLQDRMLSRRRRRLPAAATNLDQQESDTEQQDEWLSQASAMLTPPTPERPDEYPEPVPDSEYPGVLTAADYADLELDFQQEEARGRSKRKRRQVTSAEKEGWLKFPQSRRHQVYSNGTLVIQEVSRQDQGFYRCRALGMEPSVREATSNALYLSVLVPPVLSPFASADTLREGMRNFLTCSVIEGDSPVQLRWLKDGQAIEELIMIEQQQALLASSSLSAASSFSSSTSRIRVETNNEFTSTLYFSHVDFKDNGNYTCMATNKAASVNYTAKMLVNVPPKWIKAPKDLECVAGQSIVIDCQAQAFPSARVWWEIGVSAPSATEQLSTSVRSNNLHTPTLPATKLLAPPSGSQLGAQAPNHYRTIISNSRIHILENASLVIRDANKQDQGYYLCQAANNFGSLSALIKLIVNVGASFLSKYLVKYVKLNERIELECDPIGQWQVELNWFMRPAHLPLLSSNSSSLMTMMMMTGTHENTNRQHRKSEDQQHEQPSNIINNQLALDASSGVGIAALGRKLFQGTIRTEIHQQSEQQSSVGDLNGGKQQEQQTEQLPQLSSSSASHQAQISFEVVKRADGRSELARLIIKQARRFHSGDFICQASNQFGSDEKLIKLLVQEPPDPVQELSLVQVSSRSLSVSWSAPFNGNSQITSYTVEWAPAVAYEGKGNANKWSRLTTQQTNAQLTNLDPLTSYEIRVRAQNQLGLSNYAPTSPLIAQTSEEAPAAPPAEIRAVPISSSTLRLSWLPPPSSTPVTHRTETSLDLLEMSQNVGGSGQSAMRRQLTGSTSTPDTTASSSSSIKGYYLGYRLANSSSDPFVFKAVPLSAISVQTLAHSQTIGERSNLASVPAPISGQSNSTLEEGCLSVLIGELKRNTRYAIIIQAFNSAGPGPQSDPVEARTLLEDPPPAPQLRVGLTTYSSIELQWSFPEQELAEVHEHPSAPALGYHLYYRFATEGAAWTERKLSSDLITSGGAHQLLLITPGSSSSSSENPTFDSLQQASSRAYPLMSVQQSSSSQSKANNLVGNSSNMSSAGPFRFVLNQLTCGRAYQIYLVAYNSIGAGPASQIVRSKTRGGLPIPPRRQDYVIPNITWAQLNLDAWMDSGCSITNFEIRYKRTERPTSYLQTSLTSTESSFLSSSSNHISSETPDSASDSHDSQWLIVSSKLNQEQRMIELRDLESESWYVVETIAQSDAGKIQVTHSFMTLDRLGRLPAEALEVLGGIQAGSGFPALFKSGSSSIRSIFNSNSFNSSWPLLISGCISLILFASCSLFLIRRYNNLMKDTNSLNSLRTVASTAVSSHYGPNEHHHHHHHQQQQLGVKHQFIGSQQAGLVYDSGLTQEQYSLRASPCKTTTTTILAGSNSNSNAILSGSSLCTTNTTTDSYRNQSNLDQSAPIQVTNLEQVGQFLTTNPNLINDPNQLGYTTYRSPNSNTDEFCPRHCESPNPQTKFLTLSNRDATTNLEQHRHHLPTQQQLVRFKTLPHRPLSSFISQQQQSSNSESSCPARYLCGQNIDDHSYHQQVLDEQQKLQQQQQLYSKLRLIYNSNSSYNICNQDGRNELAHQLVSAGLSDVNQASYNSDTLNMALLSPQQQKLVSCTLKRGDQNLYNLTGCNGQNGETNELTALLMDCQQQQEHQHQLNEQNPAINYCHMNTNGYNNYSVAPSLNGSCTSTNNSSTQQTTTSSSATSNGQQQLNVTTNMASSTPSQLINVASGSINSTNSPIVSNNNSNQQYQKVMTNQLKLPVTHQPGQMNSTSSPQAQAPPNTNGNNNEQSDYAMPFPPKWV